MDPTVKSMIEECKRQEESCLYTSTAMYEWLKSIKWWKGVFVVTPLLLGGVSGARTLLGADHEWIAALCAVVAGLFPVVYKALDLDVSIKAISASATDFKSLQDRFRQAWQITATGPADVFAGQFEQLIDRMDAARAAGITIPEKFFEAAKAKIEAGHYTFAADDKCTCP